MLALSCDLILPSSSIEPIRSQEILTNQNSPIQHNPPSANTNAPASNCHSEPSYSLKSCDAVTMTTITLTAVTVSPALVEPTPLVNTDRGINLAENFKNCDLAVPVCNNDPQCVTVTTHAVIITVTWVTY